MRKISLSVCIVLMLISAFVTFQITYSFMTNKYESTIYSFNKWSDINSSLDNIEAVAGEQSGTEWQNVYTVLSEADSYVRSMFIGDIDEKNLLDFVMTGYMIGTGDKYCAYMSADEYEAFELSSQQGSQLGIGIRIAYDNTLGGIYVTSVIPDSPAQRAGIVPGDLIVRVEGKDVSDFGYYNSYNLIKDSAEDHPISLDVATGASNYTEFKNLSILKEIVKTESVEIRMIEDDIAYVKIIEFDSTTPEQFVSKMDGIIADGAKSFVFDVRNNPGGNVYGVAGVLDYILPEGPIIRSTTKKGEESVINSDAKSLDAPMIVLVNENTASGGELFTAALRDYDKATVIGTTTFGKGTMQTVLPLSNGGGIKVSTQLYSPPYGDNYEGIGVVPDKVVELSEEAAQNFYKLTDEQDSQLQSAIDELKGK